MMIDMNDSQIMMCFKNSTMYEMVHVIKNKVIYGIVCMTKKTKAVYGKVN